MAPVIIDLRSAEDQRDVVHRAVQALAEGKVVSVPTETVYGLAASALQEEAVERLVAAKGRSHGQPLTLAVKSADDAMDFAPRISPIGWRLARRCWPGPVTLVFEDDHPDSVTHQLPPRVRQLVVPGNTIGLRVPAHPLVLSILRLSAGPLALTSANRSGQPDAVTAQQVVESLGDAIDLVLDDGRSKFARPSSVVRITLNRVELLRSGVIAPSTLRRLSSFMILVVCTGNTCRSPMAEVMLKRRLSERLSVPMGQLEEHGVMVVSAGIAASEGGRSTLEAVQVMTERNLDLSHHESQPLSDRLVRFADVILTMTRSHRDAIVAHWPDVAPRARVLAPDASDITDPVGGPVDFYRHCADQIDAHLERWLAQLDLDSVLTQTIEGDQT